MKRGLFFAARANQARQTIYADAPIFEISDNIALRTLLLVRVRPNEDLLIGRQLSARRYLERQLDITVHFASNLPSGQINKRIRRANILNNYIFSIG